MLIDRGVERKITSTPRFHSPSLFWGLASPPSIYSIHEHPYVTLSISSQPIVSPSRKSGTTLNNRQPDIKVEKPKICTHVDVCVCQKGSEQAVRVWTDIGGIHASFYYVHACGGGRVISEECIRTWKISEASR